MVDYVCESLSIHALRDIICGKQKTLTNCVTSDKALCQSDLREIASSMAIVGEWHLVDVSSDYVSSAAVAKARGPEEA